MNLLHLEQFYAVAKAGNISVGARKLRISQPAISKSIRLLEENLNTKLFERSRRGVELTPSGKIAFDHASRIFAEVRQLADRVNENDGALLGEWCLGASDNLAVHLLPPLLARMKREHSALRIQLFAGTSSAIQEELLADRCDAGLFFTSPKTNTLFQADRVLETEFWIVLGARSEWAKKKKKWTLEDLRQGKIPRIESRHKDYSGGFPAHFHSRKLGLPESPHLEANLHEVKKRLVLEGAGYALLVKHTVEEEVRAGKMVRIATPFLLEAPIYWVTRKGRSLNRASRAFLSLLRPDLS